MLTLFFLYILIQQNQSTVTSKSIYTPLSFSHPPNKNFKGILLGFYATNQHKVAHNRQVEGNLHVVCLYSSFLHQYNQQPFHSSLQNDQNSVE